MAVKTKTGVAATCCTAVAFVLVFVAFVTSHWLETDGSLQHPKFIRIGLWEACFDGLEDSHHHYDTKFSSCWWIFEEEYYIIHDILLPGFFVATQFFFTLCFTLLLIASFLVALYLCCSRHHDRFVLLLLVVGTDLTLAAVSGTVAVVVFGVHGDSRVWMPHWEHNDMSWSYALAVLGVLFLYGGGVLFLAEGRRHHLRRRKARDAAHAEYHLEPRKGHTTI